MAVGDEVGPVGQHAPYDAGGALVVRREPVVRELAPPMGDEEIRRLFRVASSLARSGMFKDVRSAEQAFAKMIVGRDLGMTPAQSMSSLYLVEGRPVVAAPMLGHFIRSTPGYDWRVLSLDDDGCSIEFTFGGEVVGVSTFTRADAVQAGLTEKATYKKYPRNMFFSRCMSNGAKWFVPETMGGLPVYTEGEIEAGVTDGVRDGGEDAAPAAEATSPEALMGAIERALPDDHPHELAERAMRAMRDANKLVEGTWTVGKVELTLKGKALDACQQAIEEIEFEVVRMREAAEPEDAEVVEGGSDADVDAAMQGDAELPAGEAGADGEDGPSEEAVQRVEEYRVRETDLLARFKAAEPASEEAKELGVELDHVQGMIASLGFTPAE